VISPREPDRADRRGRARRSCGPEDAATRDARAHAVADFLFGLVARRHRSDLRESRAPVSAPTNRYRPVPLVEPLYGAVVVTDDPDEPDDPVGGVALTEPFGLMLSNEATLLGRSTVVAFPELMICCSVWMYSNVR
jgi:hypothetical protein